MAGSSLFTRSYSTFLVNGNFSKPKGKPNQIKGKPDQGKVKEFQEFSFRDSGLINGLRANPNFFPSPRSLPPFWPPGDPRRAYVIALRRARLFPRSLGFRPGASLGHRRRPFPTIGRHYIGVTHNQQEIVVGAPVGGVWFGRLTERTICPVAPGAFAIKCRGPRTKCAVALNWSFAIACIRRHSG